MQSSKLIIGALLLTSGIVAGAIELFEVKQTVYCGQADVIVSRLIGEDFKEVPVWAGKDAETESRIVLMVNAKTKTWTILQMDETVACLIGSGENATIIKLGKNT